MPVQKRYFNDPKLNEFLFDLIVNLRPDQKELLNTAELRSISDNQKIRRLVNQGNPEKIEILLTKTGTQVCRVFFTSSNLEPAVVKAAFFQNKKGNGLEVIEEMLRQQFFVLHSRDIALSLAIMSMNCHSQLYKPNNSYREVSEKFSDLAKRMQEGSTDNLHRSATEGMRYMGKLLLFAMGVETFLEGKYALERSDLMILLLLFVHQGRWVAAGYLKRMTSHVLSATLVSRCCRRLADEQGFIEQEKVKDRKTTYMINQSGILVAADIIRHVVNQEMK